MDTTRAGTLLGLPAFHVELRYATDERDDQGAAIEAVQQRKDYIERQLADEEYERFFDQFIATANGDGRWRLVLTDADGQILREFTR